MADGDEDPWDFLGSRKREPVSEPAAERAPVVPADAVEPAAAADPSDDGLDALAALGRSAAGAPKRERGELRAEMGGPSLRRRAWPMALASTPSSRPKTMPPASTLPLKKWPAVPHKPCPILW